MSTSENKKGSSQSKQEASSVQKKQEDTVENMEGPPITSSIEAFDKPSLSPMDEEIIRLVSGLHDRLIHINEMKIKLALSELSLNGTISNESRKKTVVAINNLIILDNLRKIQKQIVNGTSQ